MSSLWRCEYAEQLLNLDADPDFEMETWHEAYMDHVPLSQHHDTRSSMETYSPHAPPVEMEKVSIDRGPDDEAWYIMAGE